MYYLALESIEAIISRGGSPSKGSNTFSDGQVQRLILLHVYMLHSKYNTGMDIGNLNIQARCIMI